MRARLGFHRTNILERFRRARGATAIAQILATWLTSLPLDLVYNPLGPALPPDQAKLESAFRKELESRFGLRFTRLIAITNMPIGRFLRDLERTG